MKAKIEQLNIILKTEFEGIFPVGNFPGGKYIIQHNELFTIVTANWNGTGYKRLTPLLTFGEMLIWFSGFVIGVKTVKGTPDDE